MRKVVITGFGVISSSGSDPETLWKNICSGKSGIKYLGDTEFEGSPVRIAGKVDDFSAEAYLGAKDAKKYDRYIQFAVAAAQQAVDMPGRTGTKHPPRGRVRLLGPFQTLSSVARPQPRAMRARMWFDPQKILWAARSGLPAQISSCGARSKKAWYFALLGR